MTGLYLRTGGDLLLMILVHLMANWCPVPFRSEVCAEVALAAPVLCLGLGPKTGRPDDGPDADGRAGKYSLTSRGHDVPNSVAQGLGARAEPDTGTGQREGVAVSYLTSLAAASDVIR
jgi:hypothetical protein